jgi:glycosyltransferase involved in cell wall biosynthesis
VEPCSKHLASLLSAFYQAYQQQSLTQFCQQKVLAAKALINQHYRWENVAQRCRAAIATLPELPVLNPEPKLAIVSSWNSKCGIATYSKLLIQPALAQTLVLANKEVNLTCADEANVIRCWQSGGQPGCDDLEQLFNTIIEHKIEQVMIQFNFSFFELEALQALLQKLHDRAIQTFITLHSTADVYWGSELKTLCDLQPQINHVNRVFVHSIADLNQLKLFNIIDNVSLFPHGVKQGTSKMLKLPEQIIATTQQLIGKTVLASYGFLLPHKGIAVLIDAFKHFVQQQPNSHLLLITAQYPAEVSREHLLACQQLIAKHRLSDQVTLVSDFLSDDLSQAWLSLADCIVYPYQQTQESSSAAVRWGLALKKPVFCTPLAIFDDVASAVHFLPGIHAEQIAQGISAVLSNTELLAEKAQSQTQWLTENDWQRLSRRLKHILSGEFLEKAIDNNLKSHLLR